MDIGPTEVNAVGIRGACFAQKSDISIQPLACVKSYFLLSYLLYILPHRLPLQGGNGSRRMHKRRTVVTCTLPAGCPDGEMGN